MSDERDPTEDERIGMTWWNSLSDLERAYWLTQAQSASTAAAWEAYKRAQGGNASP